MIRYLGICCTAAEKEAKTSMPEQVVLSQDWLIESIRESFQRLQETQESSEHIILTEDDRHLLDRLEAILTPSQT